MSAASASSQPVEGDFGGPLYLQERGLGEKSSHLSAGTLVFFILGARGRIRCLLVTQEGRALAKGL